MFWKQTKKQEAKPEKSGTSKPVVKPSAPGRNDPCRCGSGKKYKKCCMAKDEASAHEASENQWQQATAIAKKQAEEKNAQGSERKSQKEVRNPEPGAKSISHHPTFVPHQVNMPRRSGGG